MDGPFPAYRGEQPYLFVCYAHADAKLVFSELDWLHRQGTNLWYDEGITAGKVWRAEIAQALDGASQVLYYVSRAALASDHCNREINYALDTGIEVLPIYLEEVELTPDLQIGLGRVQALQRSDHGSYRQHLMDALAHWVAEAPQTPESTPAVNSRTIAVLPFANLSGDPENEYFSDGVAEEILNALADVDSLQVVARTSAFSFKGRNVEVQQIGEALQVALVLEGSVRRGGDHVRIRVQLVDVASGFRTWSESFDRRLDDIFAVQDEVAVAVARALEIETDKESPAPGTTTENLEAYEAVLRGRPLITYANEDDARTAIRYFQRAIELDPDYGSAYGAMALQYALLSIYVPIAEIRSDWEVAFTRALGINPDDASALVSKAHYVTRTTWDWQQADHLLARAGALNMPASAVILYGQHFWALGKLTELWVAYTDALSNDPFNIDLLWDYALLSSEAGDGGRALPVWDRILRIQPDYVDAWIGKAYAHAEMDELDAARTTLERVDIRLMNPFSWHPYLVTLWRMGEQETVRRHVAELDGVSEPGLRSAMAWVFVSIGELARAIEGLEAAFAASEFGAFHARSGRRYALLQGYPEYQALLEKMNLDNTSLAAAGLR